MTRSSQRIEPPPNPERFTSQGATQYDEINSECFVDVNIGLDQFRVDTATSGSDNKALTGKKCDVGVQLARQVVAKVNK